MKLCKIVLFYILILGSLFIAPDLVQAQDNPNVECSVVEECADQGLKLATLLENRGISFSLVVVSGLVDGTNPCAIALVLLLLSSLLFFVRDEQKMFRIGFAYIGAVFVTYFLIGVAFSGFIESVLSWTYYEEVSRFVKYALITLIWAAAVINIKDVLQKDYEFTLDVAKKRVYKILHAFVKIDWITALGLGVVVTIFELPCSLPLYAGSIALLTEAFGYDQTVLYLLIYSLMFIVPLLIIFALIIKSHNIIEGYAAQQKYKKPLKAVMAAAQIMIGVGLLLI